MYEWHELIKLRQWSHSIRVRVRVWVAWWRFALSECFLITVELSCKQTHRQQWLQYACKMHYIHPAWIIKHSSTVSCWQVVSVFMTPRPGCPPYKSFSNLWPSFAGHSNALPQHVTFTPDFLFSANCLRLKTYLLRSVSMLYLCSDQPVFSVHVVPVQWSASVQCPCCTCAVISQRSVSMLYLCSDQPVFSVHVVPVQWSASVQCPCWDRKSVV